MFTKRIYILITLAAVSALLAASLPLGLASAQGNPAASQPNCPPIDPKQAKEPNFINSLPPECRTAYYAIDTGAGQPQLKITPQLTGGPDIYGYTWDDSISSSWIDTTAAMNTGLSGWGGGTGSIALPFSFKYYDNIYDSVYITSYGYLSFHNYAPWEPQDRIPNSNTPNDVIAPFWTLTYIPTGSWVHYQSGGTAPNRYFVVEWHNIAGGTSSDPYGGDDRYLFEVILYENGDIEFQYSLMAINGAYWCGTAGLENSTGLDGLTYINFCTKPTSFRTVHFYRPATGSFIDVSTHHWAYSWIESLYNNGITGGCGNSKYCPESQVTRAQMAVFLEKGINGSSFVPPAVGSTTGFSDVPTSYWAATWIKQLAADGITSGCGAGNYCPDYAVTRAQMAVFLLKSKYGAAYTPPAVGADTGFSDVPTSYWAAAWIKQLAAEGITGGCGTGVYCPESPVTRAQMAVFLVKTFSLP